MSPSPCRVACPQNFNEDPQLGQFDDQTFDAVVCCVSVQYLQYPEKVFAEIYRVLKPGGVVIMSFSNRMFYQKAISVSAPVSPECPCKRPLHIGGKYRSSVDAREPQNPT